MGERFVVKVWTNGQKHGFCQTDIHFNSGITPRQLCDLGWLILLSKPLFPDLYDGEVRISLPHSYSRINYILYVKT